jgi:SEC-C motif-containing protein
MNCPCGRIKEYEDCCGKAHQDISKALTAEDLMRSRYTAFKKVNGEYLMLSHHSSTRPVSSNEVVAWTKSVKWLKLEVINTTGGGEDDAEGTVEFKAYYRENGKKQFKHEDSKFIRENGTWVYLGFNS